MKALISVLLAGVVLAGGAYLYMSSGPNETETGSMALAESTTADEAEGSSGSLTPRPEPQPEKNAETSKTRKLSSVKRYCIHYEHFGDMISGKSVMCSDDYGTRTYEIKNLEVGMGGFTEPQNQHVITEGSKIIQWDTNTLEGTEVTNDMVNEMLSASSESADNIGFRMMEAMGFTPDGTVETIAGRECRNYSNVNIGKTCITDDGLTLRSEMMGTGFVATKVEDTAGDPKNYEVAANVTIRQMGKVGDIMKDLRSGG